MRTFLAEVPRTFAKYEAEPELSKTALINIMGEVVENHAKIEDITGRPAPTDKEACTAQHATLLDTVRNLWENARSVHNLTQGIGFFGMNGADILFNSPLLKYMNVLPESEKMLKEPYFSIKAFYERAEAKKAPVAAPAAIAVTTSTGVAKVSGEGRHIDSQIIS
jgi:hypothetical protein